MLQADFICDELSSGLRLDHFLTEKLDDFSRSQIKKHIDLHEVLVNGYPVKSGYELRLNDAIHVDLKAPKVQALDVLEPIDIPLDIIYEDEFIVVINKAAGMVIHPGIGKETETAVHALLYHCKGKLSSLGDPHRPGVVHRLDKGTTGLVVFAKTKAAHKGLAEQFKNHSAFRIYQAINWHPYSDYTGEIDNFIGVSREDPVKQVVLRDEERGKRAITRYKVIEKYPFLNLVRFKLETGRTHQIRVHSLFGGHPIFGDEVYSGREKQLKSIHVHYQKFAKNLLNYIDHQALHGFRLELEHPILKEKMRFKAELPAEMKLILQKLRSKFPDYLRISE